MGSYWKGKTVFVTGATGLMGGWLVKALLREGAEIVALIRDQAPKSMLVREGLIGRVATVSGDLECLPTMQRAIAEYSPHTVFHLAAQPLVQVAKRDPVGTLRANVMGTWNVMEACRLAGRHRTSSSPRPTRLMEPAKLYLIAKPIPCRAATPTTFRSPVPTLMAQMYAATYGVKTAIARCGNLFGGGDLNFSRTIPGLIKAALAGEPFVIRSDGKFVRDFLYVKDAAECYLTSAKSSPRTRRFQAKPSTSALASDSPSSKSST